MDDFSLHRYANLEDEVDGNGRLLSFVFSIIDHLESSIRRNERISENHIQNNRFGSARADLDEYVRHTIKPLPDPKFLRRILRSRQLRKRYFNNNLFADPAWDMLLDLAAAEGEGTRVSVTSLCIASGVPPTTALRWVTQMVENGLFIRVDDGSDRRRAFVTLSKLSRNKLAEYFHDLSLNQAPVL